MDSCVCPTPIQNFICPVPIQDFLCPVPAQDFLCPTPAEDFFCPVPVQDFFCPTPICGFVFPPGGAWPPVFPPPADPPPLGEGSEFLVASEIAGATLGGNRAVKVDSITGEIVYADYQNIHQAETVLGITMSSAVLGDPIEVMTFGEMVEPSWSWIPGLPIYLAGMGLMAQAAPTTDAVVELGIALTSTKMLIRVQHAIFQ